MLTLALTVAHPQKVVDPRTGAVLDSRRPAEVPFEVAHHLRWSSPAGSVQLAGWQDALAEPGRHWHETDGGFVAFTGDPWPRGQAWTGGMSWAAQVAEHLTPRALSVGTDHLLGAFVAVALDRDGSGTVAADPLGLGHVYWGSNGDMTVAASRASLAARLLAGAATPSRDPIAAGWLAFGEYPHGSATTYAGLEVLPPGAHLEISWQDGARLVRGRPRLWTFESSIGEPAELIDEIRRDIACSLRRVADAPAERRRLGLTGGRDSRTILAVLLDEGLGDAFELETYGPSHLRDVSIATEIANIFGLRHRNAYSLGGRAYRLERAASLRAAGYEDLSDRELALRLMVGMTSGMRNLGFPCHGHPAVDRETVVSGYCGETLRTNFPQSNGVRTQDEAAEFPFAHLQLGRAGFVRPAAREHYERQVRAMVLEGTAAKDDGRDLVDAWYLSNRLRRVVAPEQELNSDGWVYPLYSVTGLRTGFAIGPDERRAERIPYEIIRRSCPKLLYVPFDSGAWSDRLTGRPPAPSVAGPAAKRRTTSPSAPAKSSTSTVGAVLRGERAETDSEIMLRFFADASNPLFELGDQKALLEQADHLDRASGAVQHQLYGALTAAIWLGRHEITYPLGGD